MPTSRTLFTFVFVLLGITTSVRAELPTVQEVLATYRANAAKLDVFHVRMERHHEYTQARSLAQQAQVAQLQAILEPIDNGEKTLEEAGLTDQRVREIEGEIRRVQKIVNQPPEEFYTEMFLDGPRQQVRVLMRLDKPMDEPLEFPDDPLTLDSLFANYGHVRIYSQPIGPGSMATVWNGQVGGPHAWSPWVVTSPPERAMSPMFPPLLAPPASHWLQQHPADSFFSAPEETYQVVGEDEIDGKTLVRMRTAIPSGLRIPLPDENGNMSIVDVMHYYDGWLDMQQGALPVKIVSHFYRDGVEYAEAFAAPILTLTTVDEIRQLESGAVYPMSTTQLEFGDIPATDQELPQTESDPPGKTLYIQRSWTCSVAETDYPRGDRFFILPFPQHARVRRERGLQVEQPELGSRIQEGMLPPALNVATWLDGKPHALEDFSGKVVVLSFWGLWSQDCLKNVERLKALQKRYDGRPVEFISVHTADLNTDEFVHRIQTFAKEHEWDTLAAIDDGVMIQNSKTAIVYGIQEYPTDVVIGPDGIVAFSTREIPRELYDVYQTPVDQRKGEQELRLENFNKQRYAEAGLSYPPSPELSKEELAKLEEQVTAAQLTKQIDAALRKATRARRRRR